MQGILLSKVSMRKKASLGDHEEHSQKHTRFARFFSTIFTAEEDFFAIIP